MEGLLHSGKDKNRVKSQTLFLINCFKVFKSCVKTSRGTSGHRRLGILKKISQESDFEEPKGKFKTPLYKNYRVKSNSFFQFHVFEIVQFRNNLKKYGYGYSCFAMFGYRIFELYSQTLNCIFNFFFFFFFLIVFKSIFSGVNYELDFGMGYELE